MRPAIVVDANPIVSALIGGFSREILFAHHFEFITTEFTINEVLKYIPYIAGKADVSEKFVKSLLYLLPLKIYDIKNYREWIPKAKSFLLSRNCFASRN